MYWLLSTLLVIAASDSTDVLRQTELADAVQAYALPFDRSWSSTVLRTEWVDLNADGRDDALVHLTGAAWCEPDGCTILVLEAMAEEDAEEWGPYRPAAEIRRVMGPIHVAPSRTEGWQDLVVEGEGRGLRTLRFDGETYPYSPDGAPPWNGRQPEGRAFFAGAP